MPRADASAAVSVERFFQFSLLGLVASGYLAVAGSGYLDTPTIMLTAAGLLLRGLLIYGFVQFELSERASTLITIAYTGFYILDYFLLSREFLAATVHLVFFLAVMKILTAKTSRDHLYTASIAFLELLAAAILSINFNFFVFLALYLLFAIAALSSGEIRRSMHKAATTARNGPRHFHARLAALSIFVTVGILALTGGLFFLLPRTAEAAFSRLSSHRIHIPGFSNQVTLGDIGEIKSTSRPAMHIRLLGREVAGGVKWRGGTLIDFDGRRWSNPNPNPARQPIRVKNGQAELEPPDNRPRGISYTVEFDELETDALFFAGTPQRIYMHDGLLIPSDGGNYRLGRIPPQGFRYEAYSLLDEPPETAPIRFPTPILSLADRERNLQLPPLDPRLPRLAHEIAAGAATDLERVRALERYLRTEFGYTLQLPSREVADPLAYFLFTRRKGHCEYFASSLAVMLRSLGIPARLATGFQSGIYNPISDLWLVRASDAHSWVEAWIPGHGWATFDPTPPDPNSAGFAFLTKLGLYVDAAETFWQQWVVGYDSGQQLSLVDQLQQGARHLGIRWFDSMNGFGSNWGDANVVRWARRFAIRIVVALLLGVWIWRMGPPLVRLLRIRHRVQRVRRGEASVADATLLYERMLHLLKRRGYHKPVWFTPAEFARSLPRTSLGTAVSEFTVTYNALRFGGCIEAAPRLSILLDELERQERRP